MQIGIEEINSKANELNEISQQIWEKPELGFEEKHAHSVLTTYLKNQGFEVQKHTPLETSFIAKFGDVDGLKVGVMCEYDALPGIGHGCGHNLIAEAGVAVAIGLKKVIETYSSLKAQIVVFGTPDEEGQGGKVFMAEEGCFGKIDICMMTHPGSADMPEFEVLAVSQLSMTYHGKEAHASMCPWVGKNALDAAIQCYNNISMLRQQMQPGCSVHGIIVDGGAKPNIIPKRSELHYYIRGQTCKTRDELNEKVLACAEAAAASTGCLLELKPIGKPYSDMKQAKSFVQTYKKQAESLGVYFPDYKTLPCDGKDLSTGSTDMGNVSYIAPSIHPIYSIGDPCNHTVEFTRVAGLPEAQKPTLDSAKALMMTAVEILTNEELLRTIKEEFQDSY
ncbi:peptidase M20 domain-containing protein 2-like isoform X2 [Rhopilema esculentum]